MGSSRWIVTKKSITHKNHTLDKSVSFAIAEDTKMSGGDVLISVEDLRRVLGSSIDAYVVHRISFLDAIGVSVAELAREKINRPKEA